MPEETRTTLNAILDDLQQGLVAAITRGRSLDAAALQHAMDAGPLTADSALGFRLIDAVCFDDEARAKAKAAANADNVSVIDKHNNDDHKGFFELIKLLTAEHDDDRTRGRRIALAYVDGTIGDGETEADGGTNAGPFIKAMHRFADDTDVAAVVLRIHSPGGSAMASDRMWHALRRVAKRKPLIISIGDMAASGGYYLASAGTTIFADDRSLVGSIGVVGGKVVADGLAARVGVHVNDLSRGKNSGWTSMVARWSDSERAAVLKAMQSTYDTFLSRVREGRHLDGERLTAMAEGRLMTGQRARAGGLVDAAGGLEEALASAREKAGITDKKAVQIWPERGSFFDRISKVMGGGAHAEALRTQALWNLLPMAREVPVVTSLVSGKPGPYAALPFALEIR